MATDPAPRPPHDLLATLRTPGAARISLIRGTVELVAGLLALLQPAFAELAIGTAVVVISLLELALPRDPVDVARGPIDYRRVRVLFGLFIGLALVLTHLNSGEVAHRLVTLAVALLGALDLVAAALTRDRAKRGGRLARGSLFIAAAAVMLIIPTVAWGTLLLVGAIALIAGGLVTIATVRRGPLVATGPGSTHPGLVESISVWVRDRDIGAERRAEILDSYTYDPPVGDKLTRFTILLSLATVIAAVGLIADSTASIIGAMIIAPLMGPIVGIALGIVTGSPPRAMRSLLVASYGIALAILVSVAIGSWLATPTLTVTPQIVARTAPTILDLVIALASGAAGAYGASNRKVSDALAGVAISISLVPPLATVGLLLGQGDYTGASGAMLLFLTNFVSIVLAASVVFVLVGIAPIGELVGRESRTRGWLLTFAAGALVLLVPLALAFQGTSATATDEIAAAGAVQAWLPPDEGYEIVSVRVDGTAVFVELAGPLDPPNLQALDTDIDVALGRDVTTQVRVFAAVTYPAPVVP
jgi:uncharacterized hydrophobic protein (TIGR00271 family)